MTHELPESGNNPEKSIPVARSRSRYENLILRDAIELEDNRSPARSADSPEPRTTDNVTELPSSHPVIVESLADAISATEAIATVSTPPEPPSGPSPEVPSKGRQSHARFQEDVLAKSQELEEEWVATHSSTAPLLHREELKRSDRLLWTSVALLVSGVVASLLAHLAADSVTLSGRLVPILGRLLPVLDVFGFLATVTMILGMCGSLAYALRSICRHQRTPRLMLSVNQLVQSPIVTQAQSRRTLEKYLQDFRDTGSRNIQLQKSGGLSSSEIAELFKCRQRLLETSGEGSFATWIRSLDEQFLNVIERAAMTCVKRHSLTIGTTTATLPSGWLDALAVMSGSWLMLKQVCDIYGLRPSNFSLLRVLSGSLLHSVTGASLDALGDGVSTTLEEGAKAIGIDGLGTTILSKLSGRAAEGYANYRLAVRLGKIMVQSLRPVHHD